MKDTAQCNMALGNSMSAAYISSVNDNMSQSHFHDYFELYFWITEKDIITGMTRYSNCSQAIVLFSLHILCISHIVIKIVHFSRIVLYFRPDIITSEKLRTALYNSDSFYTPTTENLKNFRRLIYLFLEAQSKASEFRYEYMAALTNLILTMVVEMKPNKKSLAQQSRTTQIIDYINNNYEHDISLQNLADMLHISEYYLCREFKKNTNRTITDYIKRTRIMNAERFLLKQTKM